jgi:hypothetical protein
MDTGELIGKVSNFVVFLLKAVSPLLSEFLGNQCLLAITTEEPSSHWSVPSLHK